MIEFQLHFKVQEVDIKGHNIIKYKVYENLSSF